MQASSLFWFVAGLLTLVGGAEFLVRGASSLARRLRMSPVVIGLTIVAFGTSLPELVVSAGGSMKGLGGLAAGNVVGSNIFNIGIILGAAALITPLRVQFSLIRVDAPVMIAATCLGASLMAWSVISRPLGALLLILLAAYTVFQIRIAGRTTNDTVDAEYREALPEPSGGPLRDSLYVLGGLGALVIGSQWMVDSAVELARAWGVGEAVIGLTIVAAGTSLPELATTVLAACRRQVDIAVGNIVGSNVFNLLGILGVSAIIRPVAATGLEAVDLVLMTVLSVLLLPLMYTGRILQRWEGALLLAGYGAYLVLRWPTA